MTRAAPHNLTPEGDMSEMAMLIEDMDQKMAQLDTLLGVGAGEQPEPESAVIENIEQEGGTNE